ncbi:uncharacterized protein LOC142023822 isoform X2 [Carettochelys insculpta]|uniref:uncharacterized protein LOC142023822 isoform X2 n=1 Tax=Carettochelys insculpta TaxID=44489 RepID=UPI003EBD8627
MAEELPSAVGVGRRRGRVRKKRNFSPDVEIVPSGRKARGGQPTAGRGQARRVEGAAVLRDTGRGGGFCCDLCSSPYVIDPSRRGNQPKTSSSRPSPRHGWDPSTGQALTLCNACGLALGRPRSAPKPTKAPGAAERKQHEEQLQAFGQSMVELVGDEDGRKLCCPAYARKPCLCLQNYLSAPGPCESESQTRALELLRLLRESKQLKAMKFCSNGAGQAAGESSRRRGQRRTPAFEDFVLRHRRALREELKLCERATQRILGYSNNFLHKKLETSRERPARVERKKGKGALGLLKPIPELAKEKCCADNCTVMARTYGRLLQQWRDRASRSQLEARRVLAEMLTPSGGCRCNCYRFISWVTGSSPSTISKVNKQMKRTGGDREPPPHGLKQQRKLEQPHCQGLGYASEPAIFAQPSPLAQPPAPDPGCRPAHQPSQRPGELWQGPELQPALILMGPNECAGAGSVCPRGCIAGAGDPRCSPHPAGAAETRQLVTAFLSFPATAR